MASKIEICNMALQNMTANFITSLDEDSVEARECNFRFDTARKALLEMHPWNFAIKRASLNAETKEPAFTYKYSYVLPVDFIFLVSTELEEQRQGGFDYVNDPTKVTQHDAYGVDKYQLEGGKLLSNSTNVKIKYVSDVTDTSLFSATFTQLFSYYLASHIALKISGSRQAQNDAFQRFELKLREFQTLDSQQGVPDVIQNSHWINSRNAGF